METTQEQTFEDIGLEPCLVKALKNMSIKGPTEVQTACIPSILAGRDCIGNAQTGSGKTIAFAAPILQNLAQDPYGIYAVVLTPTRELAFQIHDQFRALGSAVNLSCTVAVGGMDMMKQAAEMRNRPHVVIATPGRLVDLLLNHNTDEWNFSKVRFLVLDEADRLLEQGFANDLATIIGAMPKEDKQTLLFTATVTEPILALQKKEPAKGKQPIFCHLAKQAITTPASLAQLYLFVPSQVRDCYLYYLLTHLTTLIGARAQRKPIVQKKTRNPKSKRSTAPSYRTDAETEPTTEPLPQTILFVSRCKTAAHLSLLFDELEIPNAALHSHLPQRERLASLNRFRASSVPLLIATDVGSRGLDIPEVQVVINWDIPREPDDYVHRVGRTARAGKKGTSVTIITEGDVDLVQAVEDRVGAKMVAMSVEEETVLESLNKVSTAQRVATIQMRAEGYGEREAINKKKRKALEGSNGKRKKVSTVAAA